MGPARAPHAELPEGLGALGEDRRDSGEREDVVHDSRLPEQPGDRGERRLGPDHAAPALEALEHGGLLTADVRAGPDSQVQVEGAVRPEHRGSHPAVQIGDVDRRRQRGEGVGVLGADVDVTLVRADCEPGDGHAFHQKEGVALHEHAIGERPAVALICIARDEFEARGHVQHRLPLDACREARPAPASKAGIGDCRHYLLRRHFEGSPQSGETPGCLVVRHRERIVDPDPCERETCLASQLGDLFGLPQAQPVRRAVEHPGVQELTDIPGFDRAVSDAPFGCGDFHERLEPEHPA